MIYSWHMESHSGSAAGKIAADFCAQELVNLNAFQAIAHLKVKPNSTFC